MSEIVKNELDAIKAFEDNTEKRRSELTLNELNYISDKQLHKKDSGGTGGGVLVVNVDIQTGALDKTWKEIHDASFAVLKVKDGTLESSAPIISTLKTSLMYYVHVAIGDGNPEDYTVPWILEIYKTNSENGYPVVTE